MLNPLRYPPGGTSGVKEPVKGKEIKEDSNPDTPSPVIRTQMVLPVKELPHFEGTKREDVITFIQRVDEIAQGAGWTDKEWVLTMVDLLGGRVALLARWIRTGLSVGQPINREVVVHHLLEAYGDGQTLYTAYKRLEQFRQQGNEKVFEFKIRLEELFWTLEDEPSKLAKTPRSVSGLLPSLNRKLCGKEYSSLAHAVEAAQVEEQRLGEAERHMCQSTGLSGVCFCPHRFQIKSFIFTLFSMGWHLGSGGHENTVKT